MEKFALIVAGGSGTRMESSVPKQFLLLHNKPLLLHTIDRFLESYDDLNIVLVLPAAYLEQGIEIVGAAGLSEKVMFVSGGETRFDSVKNGLSKVSDNSIVFVHDAVRCLITVTLIRRCFEMAQAKGNAIPAVTAIDSMRLLQENRHIVIPREQLLIIQTPQTFHAAELKHAFAQSFAAEFTDEATVFESTGGEIYLVEGERTNIKITTPIDLALAGLLLSSPNLTPGAPR